MSKQICFDPIIVSMRGNYTTTDADGHKSAIRLRETSWGKKYASIGAQPKRDIINHPFTSDELALQSAFKQAAAKRKVIVKTSGLKLAWRQSFNAAKAAGNTTANTLNGYITQQILGGNITEGNLPVA